MSTGRPSFAHPRGGPTSWLGAILASLLSAGAIGHGQEPSWLLQGAEEARPTPSAAALDQTQTTLATLDSTKQQIARTRAEIAHLQATHEQMATRLRESTRLYYRMTKIGSTQFGGGLEAWLSHFGRLRRMEKVVAALAQAERWTGSRINALQSELGSMARLADSKKLELEYLVQQNPHALSMGSVTRGWAGSPVDVPGQVTLPAETGYLRLSTPKPASSVNNGGLGAQSTGFGALRGRLSSPVVAASIEEMGGASGALRFECKAGAAVRAIGAGKVTQATAGQDQRYTVIISHGEGFQSVYKNLGSVDVEVGDTLSQGARLGTAGDGTVDEHHDRQAYVGFELQHRGGTVDAREWLGLSAS